MFVQATNNKEATPGEGAASNDLSSHDKDTKSYPLYNGLLDEIQEEYSVNNIPQEPPIEQVKLFRVRTANQCIEDASKMLIPKKLYGELFFGGEMCLMFADTGIGKSIKAVQIGDSISSGRRINGVECECEKQKVLYFDFELSDKQFELRYSNNYTNHYKFDPNFLRVEINQDAEIPEDFNDFDDYLLYSIEQTVVESGAKVVIIDNITYLKSETERAKDALPLMKRLNALKKKHGLSILVLAHTPKRDSSRPLTVNDIQGSKMLSNFTDSIFAIGQSVTDPSIKYIKQIKQRNVENKYGADNVLVFQMVKPDNFLHFEFMGFSSEAEHLRSYNETDNSELESQIKNILKNEPGITAYKIAKRLCIDESKFESFKVKVARIVKRNSDTAKD